MIGYKCMSFCLPGLDHRDTFFPEITMVESHI